MVCRCGDQATQHGYSVLYDGVGEAPADRQQLGCCTQIAIFTLTHDGTHQHPSSGGDSANQPYHLVSICLVSVCQPVILYLAVD